MRIAYRFSFALLITLGIIFSGCFKDSCDKTYTMYLPVYKTLTEVRTGMKSSAPLPLEQPGKIYVYGTYLFVNEVNKGIHIIDNSDPAHPRNLSFLPIPGNVDLAVNGSYLYADSYSDMAVFDISDPKQVKPEKFLTDVFPERKVFYWSSASSNPDSVKVVVGYTEKDTTVDCYTYQQWYRGCSNCNVISADSRVFYTAAAAAAPVGKAGSMARFSLVNNYLYTVSSTQLYSFNVSTASDPQLLEKTNIGWGIETIYPFRDKLFIGSNTGMFIFDISNAASPTRIGQFSHVRSCDPVIADDNHAFVTLRSGTQCQGFTNQLDVLDITNLMQPQLKKSYNLTNPHGLAKDNNLLMVCDGKDGLKVYDASNVTDLKLLHTIPGFETFDVIMTGGVAIVVAKDGLYQYTYSDPKNIRQLSKLTISK